MSAICAAHHTQLADERSIFGRLGASKATSGRGWETESSNSQNRRSVATKGERREEVGRRVETMGERLSGEMEGEEVRGEKVMGESVVGGREGEKKGKEDENSRRFRNCDRNTSTSELRDRPRTDCIPSRGND